MTCCSLYIVDMRWQTVVVLMAITLSAVFPQSMPLTVASGGQSQSMNGVLNICHSTTPALSSHGEIPCVNTCPSRHIPAPFIAFSKGTETVFTQLFLSKQNEHPPKA